MPKVYRLTRSAHNMPLREVTSLVFSRWNIVRRQFPLGYQVTSFLAPLKNIQLLEQVK